MARAFIPFTGDEFLELGLSLRRNALATAKAQGRVVSKASKIADFKSSFGTHPSVVALVWRDLQQTPFVDDRIEEWVEPSHLLIVYRWLKSYESEKQLKTNLGHTEKRLRMYCLEITRKVALLRKIKIDPNWEDDDGMVLCVTVDGIHYMITEPRPFSTTYSSHKLGGSAGLVYEYGVATHKNKLVWLNGPYPAGTHDKRVFRRKLKLAIEKKQNERMNDFRVIADDGYINEEFNDTLAFRNEFDPSEIVWFKDRSLARHERFNGLTKNFGCMVKKFHHDRGVNPNQQPPRHKACVEMICVTIQYEMDTGLTTLFDPYPT